MKTINTKSESIQSCHSLNQPKVIPVKIKAAEASCSKGLDLVLYLDDRGESSIKSSNIRSMDNEQLTDAHQRTADLITVLKSRRDALNKKYRRKEISSTRPIMKVRRWLSKAGAVLSLIENERSKRKKEFSVSFAQAFVNAAQQSLDPDTFGELIDLAAESAASAAR